MTQAALKRVGESLRAHHAELDDAVRTGTMRVAGHDHNGHPAYEVTDAGRELIAAAALAYCTRNRTCAAGLHHRNCLRAIAPEPPHRALVVNYGDVRPGDVIFKRDGVLTKAPYRVVSHDLWHLTTTRIGDRDRKVRLSRGGEFAVLRAQEVD